MTQTDKEDLLHTAASAKPETNTSYPAPQAHVNQCSDSDSSSDHGDSDHSDTDDDDLDKLENFLKDLRIRMTNIKNERNAICERNQSLEDEILKLRARNAELKHSWRQAEVRVQRSETDHNSTMERLSQQVTETEQRARAAETDLEDTRRVLNRERRSASRIFRTLRPKYEAFERLEANFGDHIAEALSSPPADLEYCRRYDRTSSTPAKGPDRRRHREFMPPDGPGLFVMHRGKVAWLKIYLQEQKLE
jgi:chromosome segregation ATPase